jgi:hypothetical protein
MRRKSALRHAFGYVAQPAAHHLIPMCMHLLAKRDAASAGRGEARCDCSGPNLHNRKGPHAPVWPSYGGASVVYRTACGTGTAQLTKRPIEISHGCAHLLLATTAVECSCLAAVCLHAKHSAGTLSRNALRACTRGEGGARALPSCGRSKGGSKAVIDAFAVGPCERDRWLFPAAPRRAS